MLDNLYLTNNSRIAAVEGQVNLDDLLTSTAGGVIRVKNAGAIVPLTVQSSAAQSFPMLEYLDGVQAKRTGVSDAQQGLSPDVLQNVTAAAVATMSNASYGKLELIARIFAETGVKSLFKGILQLLCKYQDTVRTLRINGKFVPFDPREWDTEYNVTINVGLGTGSRQEQLATMQMILGKQEQILQAYGVNNPLISIKQYRDTLAKFVHMAGFKDATAFMNEITPEIEQQVMQQASQEKADPNTQAAEILAQVEREKAQLRAQTEAAKLQLDREQMQLENQRKSLELQQKELVQTAELALKEMQMKLDAANMTETAKNNQTKTVMDAIGKINDITQGSLNV
jgi:hypothetical protein